MEQNSFRAPPETVPNELTSNHRRAFCADDSFIDNLLHFDPVDFEISDISFPPSPPPATTEMTVVPIPEPVEPQVLRFTSESDHPNGIGMSGGGTDDVGEKGMKRSPKYNVSVDLSSTASSSVRRKVMSADTLDELAKTDPKKVKRILANRKAAARSKERKSHYLNELEMRVQSLQLEANNLNEELEMLKKNNEDLTAWNNLARNRIEAVIQEGEKKHELFKIHCRADQVIDHIIPPTSKSTDNEKEKATEVNSALWSRLDAIVLQWIYGTISNDLLHTILQPDSTAQQAWERLQSIFQDNKNSRAVYLENQFTHVHMDDYPNISAYCQELKMLVDQLSNVGASVSNQRLVLQLIAGLNENYNGVATFIQQSDLLPPFYEARSRLILEETCKAKQAASAANTTGTTPLTTNNSTDDASSFGRGQNTGPNPSSNRGNNGPRCGQNRGRGRNGGGRGRGRNNNHNSGQQHGGPPQQRSWQHQPSQWMPYPPWGPWGQQPWAAPPCPYPTSSWTPPARQPGILGNRPQQALSAHGPPSHHAPTDIDAAMQTLSLNVPDENWYMDTGATSHMTASRAFNQSLEEETRTLRIQIDKNAALMGNNPSVGELVSQISSKLATQQFPNTQTQLQLAAPQQPLCVLPPPPQPSPFPFAEPISEHFVGSSFSNYNQLNYNHHK